MLGSRGVELPGMAVDFKVTTDLGTRRIARAAFEYAKNNGKKHVSIVTKANIMKKTDGKFSDKPVKINKYIKGLPTVTVNGKDYRFINGIGFGIDGYCCEVGDEKKAKGKGKKEKDRATAFTF